MNWVRALERNTVKGFPWVLSALVLLGLVPAVAGVVEEDDVYDTELATQKQAYKDHMIARDYDAAIGVLLPLVAEHTDTVTAARLCEHIGRGYMLKQDYAAAVTILSQAKNHAADSQWTASSQELIGASYMNMGNYPKAIEAYQHLIDQFTAPKFWALARTAETQIAIAHIRTGDYLGAAAQFRRVIVSYEYPDFEPRLSSITFKQEIPWGGTVGRINRIFSPAHPEWCEEMIGECFGRSKIEEESGLDGLCAALDGLVSAGASDPGVGVYFAKVKAERLAEAGRYADARAAYAAAVQMVRNSTNRADKDVMREALSASAETFLSEGRPGDAVAVYTTALADFAGQPDVVAYLHEKAGDLQLERKDYATALGHYQALGSGDVSETVYARLVGKAGLCRLGLGETQQGRELLYRGLGEIKTTPTGTGDWYLGRERALFMEAVALVAQKAQVGLPVLVQVLRDQIQLDSTFDQDAKTFSAQIVECFKAMGRDDGVTAWYEFLADPENVPDPTQNL